jgi:hypothetical protein
VSQSADLRDHDEDEARRPADWMAILERGVGDAPQLIYDRPNSLDVAFIVGSSATNFVFV